MAVRQISVNADADPGEVLRIGYEGEDKITQISFKYSLPWLTDTGNGTFAIRVLRHGDTEVYNATRVTDDRESMTLTMDVTDIELSKKGYGEMQLVCTGADGVRKSPVFRYYVARSIDGDVVDPPEGSVINQVVRELEEVQGDLESLVDDVSTLENSVGDLETAMRSKASTDVATTEADGLMSAQDKTRLDSMYEDYMAAFDALGGGST